MLHKCPQRVSYFSFKDLLLWNSKRDSVLFSSSDEDSCFLITSAGEKRQVYTVRQQAWTAAYPDIPDWQRLVSRTKQFSIIRGFVSSSDLRTVSTQSVHWLSTKRWKIASGISCKNSKFYIHVQSNLLLHTIVERSKNGESNKTFVHQQCVLAWEQKQQTWGSTQPDYFHSNICV